jgi:hypothetical protein
MKLILWSLIAAFLIVVGLWPAAVAPIALAFTGAAVILGKIPGVVLVAIGGIAYLKHRPAHTATA